LHQSLEPIPLAEWRLDEPMTELLPFVLAQAGKGSCLLEAICSFAEVEVAVMVLL
jgi:hypothetical protein